MEFKRRQFQFRSTSKVSILDSKKSTKNVIAKRTNSIKLTIFLMRALGLWHSSGKIETIVSSTVFYYVVFMMIFSIFTQFTDLYYASSSLAELSLVAPVACLATTEFMKVMIFVINRKKVMRVNRFVNENYWQKEYSEEETIIFNNCERVCARVITFYVICGQCVFWHYVLLPLFGEKTEGIKKLPFSVPFYPSLNLNSPYYEILYLMQFLGSLCVFFDTVTFASYLFSVSLFTAAQFRMLSKNLESLCDFGDPSNDSKNFECQSDAMKKLKELIKTHQMLIYLTKEVEDLYCYILLGQMIGSVIETSFCGLQILFVSVPPQRNVLTFNLMFTCILQLYLFCYSSHEVFIASENVAQATYFMKWYEISDTRIHKEFALSLEIIGLRARRPCILSVGKFYPLTLETFASVLSTSISYFTVLRQIIE